MLNWIDWNITVYSIKMDLALNNLQSLICHKTQANYTKIHRGSSDEKKSAVHRAQNHGFLNMDHLTLTFVQPGIKCWWKYHSETFQNI